MMFPRALLVLVCLCFAAASAGAQEPVQAETSPPRRVVSMNLCTDQLALLLAAKGQLLSVSYLAVDPRSSAMAEEARAYPINRGLAEEIYLLQPDLVVAGSFTTQATVAMLRRLGVPVVTFQPARSLEEVSARLLQMGEVLGRTAAAEEMVASYERRLAAFRAEVRRRPSAALYYANGYTSGDRSLAGQILSAAGFENVAVAAGFASGGLLPLEVLALANPDTVITSRPYPGASRSEEILDHPVVRTLRAGRAHGGFADRDWVCGTPRVLAAVEEMGALRRSMTGE